MASGPLPTELSHQAGGMRHPGKSARFRFRCPLGLKRKIRVKLHNSAPLAVDP
jgi:hypothetical protein